MKTHFNYVFIEIKQLISDVCAFVVLCTLIRRFFFSDLRQHNSKLMGRAFKRQKNVD